MPHWLSGEAGTLFLSFSVCECLWSVSSVCQFVCCVVVIKANGLVHASQRLYFFFPFLSLPSLLTRFISGGRSPQEKVAAATN
mgnify:CR=1 FL=1